MHLLDSLIVWGYQGGDFDPFSSLGLLECILFALRQPGAARVYIMDHVTAGGCQGVHNGPCDSLGWQRGDFAFSASFWILNEIMLPGAGTRPLS